MWIVFIDLIVLLMVLLSCSTNTQAIQPGSNTVLVDSVTTATSVPIPVVIAPSLKDAIVSESTKNH